jgi:hypothetical protein
MHRSIVIALGCLALVLPLAVAQDEEMAMDVMNDCGAEFKTTTSCMFDGLMDVYNSSDMAHDMDEEAFEKELLQCFPDAGCVDIAMFKDEAMKEEEEENEDGDALMKRLQSVTEVLGINPDKLKNIINVGMECAKGMSAEVKPKIEMCVQQSNPLLATFEMPSAPKKIEEKLGGPGAMLALSPVGLVGYKLYNMQKDYMEGMHGFKELGFASMNPYVCPTPESRTTVKTCIMGVEEKYMPKSMTCSSPMTMIFGLLEMREGFCAKREVCEKAMTETCWKLVDRMPSVMCTCAESFLNDNWDELVTGMMTCINSNLTEPVSLPMVMINGPFKHMAKHLLKKQCMHAKAMSAGSPDPCSTQFNPFDMMDEKKMKKMMKGGKKYNKMPMMGMNEDGSSEMVDADEEK